MKLKNPVLKVLVPTPRADDIAYVLQDEGALAIEERDPRTMTTATANHVEFVAGFENENARNAAHEAIQDLEFKDIVVTPIDEMDDDWQTRWREFFKPVVLSRLQVITPWMSPPRDDLMTIVIDPGQAFGTGGHATTKLVLSFLEDLVAQNALPDRILDVGTGSGILAFAARKLGARQILGIDIDSEAKAAFDENAERNGMTDTNLTCRVGEASSIDGVWPLVLANIQIDAFRLCHEAVAARVSPEGSLIISGILTDQVEELLALFDEFTPSARRDDGEWVALRLNR